MAKILTPEEAIRKYCLQCSGNSRKEVELCEIKECSLYHYRFGPVKEPDNTPVKETELEEMTQKLEQQLNDIVIEFDR